VKKQSPRAGEEVEVRLLFVDEAARARGAPEYQTAGSAGLDLRANVDEPLTLQPGERALIPTGLALAVPPGYEGQVRPRSGLAWRHGLTCLNSPGTIDSDYRGEIKLIVANLGSEPYRVSPGERLAQLIIAPVTRARLVEVDSLDGTARSKGGFGHTGSE